MKKVLTLILTIFIILQLSIAVNATEKVTLTGMLNAASFTDGLGDEVEYCFVKLAQPQIFKLAYEDEVIDIETDEVQVSIDNFSENMVGKIVEVCGEDIFIAHSFYHRKDVVMIGATAKIIEKSEKDENHTAVEDAVVINYATEYKKILDGLINTYGISHSIDSYDCSNGVVHCELLDLDGNGSPEMYVLLKRSTEDEYWPEYLHQIYCYNNGTAALVLENSRKIHNDLWDFKFYKKIGKVYLLEELSAPCMDLSFADIYSSYYSYYRIKEFNGTEFVDVWVYNNSFAGAPTREELIASGYSEEAGYTISYIENEWGNYYFSDNTHVIQNGIKRVINRTSMDFDSYFDELIAFVGKENFAVSNDCIDDKAINFLEYSSGGEYTVENIDYNAAAFSELLNDLSVKLKNDRINVVINGKTVEFDQNPIIVNGRTLVPMRAIFEALGATVEWENNT